VNWRDQALCGQAVATGELTQEQADNIFFEWGQPVVAQRYCGACPVSEQCGEFASANRIPYGVFGGEQGAARRRRLGISNTESPFDTLLLARPVTVDAVA
jgi:hypothetical protein